MPLPPGTRLGSFEILAPLGAGGMGEVYRAKDTKLGREVAIKLLPAAFAQDPERLARFENEARVLASLNHPNIAAIFGVEERALVMELVEGESPAPSRGSPMPFDEAWRIASQIAAALEYAHDKGIVHRDLKPANLKVTADGVVKLLDFGLAKAFQPNRDVPAPPPGDSPTLTMGATEAGMILGTAAYMAPEQARGKNVDKRADIWAFGVVLAELLTGERLFQGEDAAEILAAVIHKQPDLEKVPVQARTLVAACLEKDPRNRLRDIGDAKRLLSSPRDEAVISTAGTSPLGQSLLSKLGWVAGAVGVVAAIALSFIHFREAPPANLYPAQYGIVLPSNANASDFTISPDGRYLAYAVGSNRGAKLFLRTMATGEVRAIPGGDSTGFPFWSPDSTYVGFCASGKLRIAPVAGGPSQPIADCASNRHGAWNESGVILLAGPDGIQKTSAQGESLTKIVPPPVNGMLQSASFLPDQDHFLFTANSGSAEDGIYAASLSGGSPVRILPDLSSALFVPARNSAGGDLLFVREGNLMAQPFDVKTMRSSGSARHLAGRVSGRGLVGTHAFSASNTGVLIYRQLDPSAQLMQLVWIDRTGRRTAVASRPEPISRWSLSPNDDRVVADWQDKGSGKWDNWVLDIAHGTWTRLTTRNEDQLPAGVWSPDGTHITFVSRLGPTARDIYSIPADASGREELLFHGGENAFPLDWSRDGEWFVYSQTSTSNDDNIWLYPIKGDHTPVPYLATPANERQAQISPDGQWMAYASDESGRPEIYVQSLPMGKGKFRISIEGGTQPRWRHDGSELFFASAEGALKATAVKLGAKFQFEAPRVLFSSILPAPRTGFTYATAKDGQRFLVQALPEEAASVPALTVFINWQM